MGIVLWRASYGKPKNCDFGGGQNLTLQKKVMISTSGPAAEIPDGADGCAGWFRVKSCHVICCRVHVMLWRAVSRLSVSCHNVS